MVEIKKIPQAFCPQCNSPAIKTRLWQGKENKGGRVVQCYGCKKETLPDGSYRPFHATASVNFYGRGYNPRNDVGFE
jgi:hypothetical protein